MLPEVYENEYFKSEVLRKIVIDGHEVGWTKTTVKTDYVEYMVSCQCCFDAESGEFNPWHRGNKKCKYMEAAMALRREEIRQEIRDSVEFDNDDGTEYLLGGGEFEFPYISPALKNAIVELFERSQRHEWLGMYSDQLYGVHIREILRVNIEDIWTCVIALEREGKLASGTGTGSDHAGQIVPYDIRRKRKHPEYPYLEKKVSTFKVEVFSPLSGFDPLEWYILVTNHRGKKAYVEHVPLKYGYKWPKNEEGNYHPIDVARLNLALAEIEEKIWKNFIEHGEI